jgi:hypothetical protein
VVDDLKGGGVEGSFHADRIQTGSCLSSNILAKTPIYTLSNVHTRVEKSAELIIQTVMYNRDLLFDGLDLIWIGRGCSMTCLNY